MSSPLDNLDNPGVEGLPYFTPKHAVPPGTPNPKNTAPVPTLFKPLTIRGATLRNRILVAPMCQYSTSAFGAEIGALTDYHIATLGHYALKGAALVFIEATGVQPNGRISPNCPGLWSDAQIPALRRVSDFIKSQGALSGIQLAHAGRKGSTAASWMTASKPGSKLSARAGVDIGGWPDNVVGPMGGEEWTWDGKAGTDIEGGYCVPRALSEAEIQELVQDWAKAAERAVKAGVDVIEIHGAHGYLIHQFLSPLSNRRTDRYGGSFENRTRLLIEIIRAIRSVIPTTMPLFLRISATEWLENSELGQKYGTWDMESSISMAKLLPALGVDLLDVSSAGNNPHARIPMHNSYQVSLAERIRIALRADNLKLLIGAVGLITEAEQARAILEDGGGARLAGSGLEAELDKEARAAMDMTERKDGTQPMADVVLVARQFMREPEWVLKVAHRLGVDIAWPSQFSRVRFPRL